ncbi:choloylglycine hydrolase family protein [Ligilactobacillus ruminis]|uniref:Linear amide C-N hydrolase, choloylglycine hydrolase family protein n=1 Tax=Ligilactobacillus ruminis ATCC 25644 TaxID=525362 RepID=E7FMY6_9LACO|nr:choloylglycine hydrolase family protein [Ligilactobacillus ruminis]EFZ35634.1 linear amide C-N hydrolase, choloylglycine hydrolase family protein [Ligilactobacillus ruminis ATCC 25644]EGX98766.1 choloylglycine hydrolase [Ligilactobacillus ruminis ATCC 25644]UWP39924.1 choloylglycine hydrolase family protein [Ligilactobacillus ruminis]
MCTAVTFTDKKSHHYLARTMDFSFELDTRVVSIPKNHVFDSLVSDGSFKSEHAFLAAGQEIEGYGYSFGDGFNEKGFAIASLYFEKYAKYSAAPIDGKTNLASTDLVAWALGNAESVDEFAKKISSINIVDVVNPVIMEKVPLHWIVTDGFGNDGVLEITESGVHFYRNQVGVMTNPPEFPWHMENLNHYNNLQPNDFGSKIYGDFTTFWDGPGSGTRGLPGDYTSISRFVRAAYVRQYSERENGLLSLSHILNAVDIPKGVKKKSDGLSDYTQYKAIIDLDDQCYYFMKYGDAAFMKACLDSNSDEVKEFQH